jgi:D-cysteine desulfhydrase family pyridoxal phosphate-dependent enzyme
MIRLPQLKIAALPTPVQSLPRLSARMGGPQLWVKRDDLTGLALGGNKTRKLEFLLAEAQANGARTLITAGALQSNHCRQTAAAAARFGFRCILVLAGEPPERRSGNLLLDHLLGAELVFAGDPGRRDAVLQYQFDVAWEEGLRPYLIPYGGSNPTGAAAYTAALRELLDQGARPDWIVFPSSSGGTQAGLALGAALHSYGGKVLGISVDEPAQDLKERVADLASRTADLLGAQLRLRPEDILVNADYLGGGYGVLSEAEKEAVRLFAREEGLLLDPVYTGRAAAGLLDLAHQGFFEPGAEVLFWHTGGTPALFAERYQELGE